MVDKFDVKVLDALWGSGKPILFKGKKYRVNKMSYGKYFLEPFGWSGSETDGFASGTLWLKKSEKFKNFFEIDDEGLN